MSRTVKTTLVVLGMGAVALVFWSRQRLAQPPAAVAKPEPPATEMASTAAPKAALDTSGEVQALKGRLADEMRARQRAEAEAAALRAKVPPPQSNVVVSL